MKLYEAQFSETFDIDGGPAAPSKTIIIASTPRSGSHMLGHSMTKTNAMGAPFEYCNSANLQQWRKILGVEDVRDVLRAIMARRTSPNGVFAIKLHHDHLAVLGGLDGAMDFFPNPHFVQICRGNLLKQAISMSVAQQTGVWISEQAGNGRKAVYSQPQITRNLRYLASQVAKWQAELAARGLPVLTVEFNQVATDVSAVLARLATHCGIDDFQTIVAPPTIRQSTSRSDEWVDRYSREIHPPELMSKVTERLLLLLR